MKNLLHTTHTFNTSTPYDIRSIGKSVMSLLWSAVQRQDRAPPLNTPILSLFPVLVGLNHGGHEAITFLQMPSMPNGLVWDKWHTRSLFNSDEFGLF